MREWFHSGALGLCDVSDVTLAFRVFNLWAGSALISLLISTLSLSAFALPFVLCDDRVGWLFVLC